MTLLKTNKQTNQTQGTCSRETSQGQFHTSRRSEWRYFIFRRNSALLYDHHFRKADLATSRPFPTLAFVCTIFPWESLRSNIDISILLKILYIKFHIFSEFLLDYTSYNKLYFKFYLIFYQRLKGQIMMQGLYNKKIAMPSVLDTLSALFIVPSGVYTVNNNLTLFSLDSSI